MRNLICLILLAFTYHSALSQIKATVLDSTTKKTIPYVNVWLEGENNGTSCDETGSFTLDINTDKTITLSAVGYQKKNIKTINITDVIYMKPQAIELNELVINKSKNSHTLQIGSVKKPKMTHYVAMAEDYPVMHSNYYPYKKDYDATPYFKTLKLITNSELKTLFLTYGFIPQIKMVNREIFYMMKTLSTR